MTINIQNLIGTLVVVGNDVNSNEIEQKVTEALTKAIASASKETNDNLTLKVEEVLGRVLRAAEEVSS